MKVLVCALRYKIIYYAQLGTKFYFNFPQMEHFRSTSHSLCFRCFSLVGKLKNMAIFFALLR